MRWASWAIVAATLHAPTAAWAVGGGVGVAESPLVESRVAISVGAGQATHWVQVRFAENTGTFAWLVPVPPGARVDEVGAAWLDSIDKATAPRVGDEAVAVDDDAASIAGARAVATSFLGGSEDLGAWTSSWGLSLPSALRARAESLLRTDGRLLGLVYAPPASATWTAPLRITDSTLPRIPLFLTGGSQKPVRITAFVLAAARARIGVKSLLTIDAVQPRYGVDGSAAMTEYRAARDRLLLDERDRWILEYAGSVPIVVPQAEAADGQWGREDGGPACDQADDWAVAFSGLTPAQVWITRTAGIVAPSEYGADWDVVLDPGPAQGRYVVGSVRRERGVQAEGVHGEGVQAEGVPLAPSSSEWETVDAGPRPDTIQDASSDRGRPQPAWPPRLAAPSETTVVIEEPVSESETEAETPADSCTCSGTPSQDDSSGCNGQPSSTSASDQGDGCSGSSESEYDDESDSSGCDGSSEDDSGSDSSGCSSDTSDDSSSDSCSSNDSPDTQPASECGIARRRGEHRKARPRLRFSQLTVALAALLLPIRRWSRRERDGAT